MEGGELSQGEAVLSGAEEVDGVWEQHSGSIFKTRLSDSKCSTIAASSAASATGAGGGVQQAWLEVNKTITWFPEARYPNVNLTAGAAATAPGGPLSQSSWAKTYGIIGQNDSCKNCTKMRQGILSDPALASSKVDWTGALLTLNTGFRFFTWTRRVQEHTIGSSILRYNQSLGKGSGQIGLVGGEGSYLGITYHAF